MVVSVGGSEGGGGDSDQELKKKDYQRNQSLVCDIDYQFNRMQADGFTNFPMSKRDFDSDSEISVKLGDRDGSHCNQTTSLLGKPFKLKGKKDAKYRKLQAKVYNFLERPSGKCAFLYHGCVFIVVFLCLALSIFSTLEEYEEMAGEILFYIEIVIVGWFGVEFVVRFWSAGCRSRFQGWLGRLSFLKSPFCLIDIITISASLVVLSGLGSRVVAASALRGLRFFQILRMVRMDRRGGTWKLLGTVIFAHRQELFTTLYIGFIVLIFSSFVVYMVEKDHNENFASFAHSLWWGVITLCTVGYGDAVPITWKGKLMASVTALCGISFFALPAGILGSGFALKVQQQQRQKHMIRRRVPAATLIQCLWRCYAADENSTSEVTWRMHMVPARTNIQPRTSPPTLKGQGSFVNRLPTLRSSASVKSRNNNQTKNRDTLSQDKQNAPDNYESQEEKSSLEGKSMRHSRSKSRSCSLNPSCNPSKNPSKNPSRCQSPRNSKGASRASSPFPWAGANFNASLPAAPPANFDSTDPALPLMLCTLLQREFCMQSPRRKRNNTSSKDEEDEGDDEEESVSPIVLTPQHKGAIRTIRKLKYMLARRRFKEALRPYDVKDVIESYSAGHADLVTKVKNLSTRLDQILGKQGTKAKDVYDSKISLASRIVNTERQVDMIEEKLQLFIDMYEEDRKRLHALTYAPPAGPPCTPCPDTPISSSMTPPLGYPQMVPGGYSVNQYSSVSHGLHRINSQHSIKARSSLSYQATDPRETSPPGSPPTHNNGKPHMLNEAELATALGAAVASAATKRPFKKRVTLASIPSNRYSTARMSSSDGYGIGGEHLGVGRTSLGNIVPPSVRIEGCTPPSDNNSLGDEGGFFMADDLSDSTEICQYLENYERAAAFQSQPCLPSAVVTAPEIVITGSPVSPTSPPPPNIISPSPSAAARSGLQHRRLSSVASSPTPMMSSVVPSSASASQGENNYRHYYSNSSHHHQQQQNDQTQDPSHQPAQYQPPFSQVPTSPQNPGATVASPPSSSLSSSAAMASTSAPPSGSASMSSSASLTSTSRGQTVLRPRSEEGGHNQSCQSARSSPNKEILI